jgi:hypothetical protein
VAHAHRYCHHVAHISRGTGTPTADGWRLVEWSGPGVSYSDDVPIPSADRATGWFVADEHPAVRVVVTFLLDGTLLSFEVHNEGMERAHTPNAWLSRKEGGWPLADVPILSRLVRAVPIGELVRVARATVAEFAEAGAVGFKTPRLAGQMADHARKLRGDTKRPGRRGHPDRYYAELAVAYEAWQATGDTLKVFADRVHLTSSGLRAALHTARQKGFLTKAPPGKAGGMATEKAKELARGIDR